MCCIIAFFLFEGGESSIGATVAQKSSTTEQPAATRHFLYCQCISCLFSYLLCNVADTVVYTHAKTAELAAAKLTIALVRITHWLDQSCLSLNVNKTKGMFSSKSMVQPPKADILIKGEKIDSY